MELNDPLTILALIPAYNEAQRIGAVVAGAAQYLPVLVLDDGSTDDTAAVALRYGATVLSQRPNQGKGAALKAGFHQAIASGYVGTLTLDADGQHDPGEIPKFLQAYQAREADLIVGARDFSQIPPVRRAANTLGRWSFSWAVGRPVHDNQSGYRLISRRLMEAMLASQEQGFQFEVEMIVVCVQKGYVLDWVPIRTIYAGESSHIQPLQHVIEFTRMVLLTRKRLKK
jgi:glycosyltransferase involved in cell wall biosynthesis